MPQTAIAVRPDTEVSPGTEATAVIYLRVSSDGQVSKAHDPEGYSIPTQRESCERHAERLGARVVAEFVELGRTGTNLQRPALQNMLAALPEIKPTYVIFYDLSRVAREEQDAFWLLGEIKRHGAKLESTLERIDDSPQGLLLYAIMAGVNAFRSRGDGEKVKGGLARKHADGGSMGPARIGYLNDSETVEGRKIATISIDHDRVDPYGSALRSPRRADTRSPPSPKSWRTPDYGRARRESGRANPSRAAWSTACSETTTTSGS
jgi:site-specific DNA recombinase